MAGWKLSDATSILPEGYALWTPGMLGASLLAFQRQKDMKGKKGTKGEGRYAANIRFTIRLTPQEKTRLDEQADIAGLSLSEYARRRFFGGTIAAYTDVKAVGELRRSGGLLKHNFATLRQANMPPDILERQEDALRKLVWLIQKIGLALDDRQKNQESEN